MIKLSPNAKQIRKDIKNNDGYCPCALFKTVDTKCPCKDFRETQNCICGLYIKTDKE